MSLEEVCEMAGCNNTATRLTSTETKYITICEDCWHQRYRN